MVTNTVTGAVTRLGYDGDGQRLWRATAEELTVYLGAVEVTLRGTERVTTTYYFVGGQRVAMRQGETLTYLHGDHLGSASLATDASGAIASVRLLQAPSATTALQLLKMQLWLSKNPSRP